MTELQRCSVLSLAREESQLGTAFAQRRVLLVEQPGPWGPAGLTESRYDAPTARELERRASAAGVRVQAIRRHGRDVTAARRRWALADAATGSIRWGSFGRDTELIDLPFDLPDGGAPAPDGAGEQPVYLVCTHARRDQCCAIEGRPLAARLGQLAPGAVWETSHLGGHRFAATLLVLPLGVVYGRVPLTATAELVQATSRGEVVPGLLRGRIGLQPAEQAADGFLRGRLGILGASSVVVLGSVVGTDGLVTVELDASGQRYAVAVRERVVERDFVSCGKPAAKPQREYAALAISEVP